MIRRYLSGLCRLIWQRAWLRYPVLLGLAGALLYVGLWLTIMVCMRIKPLRNRR